MGDDENATGLPDLGLPDVEPINCQLANGHEVKITAGFWSRWRTRQEKFSGGGQDPYFGIRIYCTEGTLPKKMIWVEEFLAQTDFHLHDFETIWRWLDELCKTREVFVFDDLAEFLDHVVEGIIQISTEDSDAVEHIKHLPQITDPEGFDKVDDSIFNDQNDSGPVR